MTPAKFVTNEGALIANRVVPSPPPKLYQVPILRHDLARWLSDDAPPDDKIVKHEIANYWLATIDDRGFAIYVRDEEAPLGHRRLPGN